MLYVLGLLGGMVLPVQGAVNAALREQLKQPILAALASFFVGTCCLAVLAVVSRAPMPQSWPVGSESWKWIGGSLGVIYVVMSIILMPKLGSATTTGLFIAGQLLASLLLDHFGWIQLPQHSLSVPRVAGALFLGAGVYLIRKY